MSNCDLPYGRTGRDAQKSSGTTMWPMMKVMMMRIGSRQSLERKVLMKMQHSCHLRESSCCRRQYCREQ